MKKSLLALAILGAFAGAASAQSSVTVYGIVDASIARIDDGVDTVTRIDSGRNAASRIGFKGTEDLGGGLKANFTLEAGFDASTGESAGTVDAEGDAGPLFSRLSWLGLQGGFGEVRLGRQDSAAKIALNGFDPFVNAGMAGSIDYFAGGNVPERVSNQLMYISPNFGGFQGSASYVFGEEPGVSDANRGYTAQLGYKNGPMNVQFGYANMNASNEEAAVAPTVDVDTKTAFLGGTYDFGAAKLHAGYGESKAENELTGADNSKFRSALIGVTVPMGASAIRASYINTSDRIGDADYDMFAVSYTYAMSKRTKLYATYALVDNDAGSAKGIIRDGVDGEKSNGIAVGVQHNF